MFVGQLHRASPANDRRERRWVVAPKQEKSSAPRPRPNQRRPNDADKFPGSTDHSVRRFGETLPSRDWPHRRTANPDRFAKQIICESLDRGKQCATRGELRWRFTHVIPADGKSARAIWEKQTKPPAPPLAARDPSALIAAALGAARSC